MAISPQVSEKVNTASLPSTLSSPTSTSPSPVVSQQTSLTKTGDTLDDDGTKKLSKEEALALKETEKEYKESLAFIKDMIAPSMMKIDATKLQIGDTFIRTIFTYTYPDVLEGNWLSPLINWDVKFDMSMFVYPVSSGHVMKYLRRRLTQLRSQYSINQDK